jgi:hypothetical protein
MMAKISAKKFIVSLFVVLILISVAPKPVFAAVPTFEVNPTLTDLLPMDLPNIGEMTFEWAFGMAVEMLKRQLLNMIVDQIVNWIQGGGSPKFITDWPGFFRDAVDQAGGKFLQQLGLSQLCSPFKPLLSAAFIPIPTFTQRTSCTLSQVGANLDAFLKDFRSGGWIAWNQMVLSPQNNVYGAYIMAWDQYEIEKSAAAKAAEAEAYAGRGFLGVRKCLETKTQPDGAGGFESYCSKETIVTPGSVVGDLAAKAVGSDIDYIVNAQDFKAYVAAIANAILNRLFSEGLGQLKTAFSSGGSGGGGGGGGTVSAAQAQCAAFLGTPAYTDCVNSIQSGTDIREFQKNNLITLISTDLTYQNQLLGAKQATLTILNQSIDILNQLKACQGSAPSALVQVQSDITNTANQIAQIQSDIIALQVKQNDIKKVTDITLIPSLYVQVASIVNPAKTQSLAMAAQQETSQKQQAMNLYQQQLSSCLQQQQQSEGGGSR